MLTRQQKRTLITATKFVVPLIFVFILVVTSLNIYTIRAITHPKRTEYSAGVEDYKITGVIIQKTDETWSLKGGGTGNGWLLRAGTGAPAIVLSHSYGQNLADLLSLGVAIQRSGYHVLLYDLRGHGHSKEDFCSLGEYEVDDVLSAVDHLKELKDADGNSLVDKDRIGLYGASLGGYASLVAAGKDPSIKAVVVDAVYPDVKRYLQIKVKDFSGLNNGFVNYFTDLGMKLNFSNKYGSTSAVKTVRAYTDVKQLYILGKDAGDLLTTTREVYDQAALPKETVEVPHSSINILYRNDQDVYDPVVVEFFHRPDVMPATAAQAPLKAELKKE
jgi:pimeloyl-ACP methyl ester carboxylesterase